MDEIYIKDKDWELIINLNGGRIESLKNKGGLILGTFERIDGKTGNTHVCAPNFANDGVKEFGLIFHGPFRNLVWLLKEKGDGKLIIYCEDSGLKIQQSFSLVDNVFRHNIVIENVATEKKPVNMAVHNYWSTESGWYGLLMNEVNMEMAVRNSEFIELKPMNVLNMPGKTLLNWQVTGFKYAKLWTGFLEEGNNKIFDNNYVCIEPIMEKDEKFFGSEDSMLLPGEKKEVEQIIGGGMPDLNR